MYDTLSTPCIVYSINRLSFFLRNDLEQTLEKYISDTFTYIHITKTFCDNKIKTWYLQRAENLDTMKGIKDNANKSSTKLIPGRRQKLEKDLGDVLKSTLDGLSDMLLFLEAVEKLSVTSAFVFTDACSLPIGVSAEHVHSVIFAARMAASLMVHFKRDDRTFFIPSLSNLEVQVCYLDKYMSLLQQICKGMEERLGEKVNVNVVK